MFSIFLHFHTHTLDIFVLQNFRFLFAWRSSCSWNTSIGKTIHEIPFLKLEQQADIIERLLATASLEHYASPITEEPTIILY